MAGEWRPATVGEVAPLLYGRGLPERSRHQSGAVPVFGSNGIVGYHSEALSQGPTVVIGRKGSVGAVHYSPGPCWPIDTTFYYSCQDSWLARFHYYLLSAVGLGDMNSHSAVPGLSRDAVHALTVKIPESEAEQRAIAHILGTLDDKIELNRRMSETLEAIARALFKSWFVDFDPVRAKMEGRDPGLPKDIADLFPDRLVESELGEIPEGWRSTTLGSFVSQRTVRVGSRAVLVLSAVASGQLVRSDEHFVKRVYSQNMAKYLLVEEGDFAYNPSRINIGSIGMLEDDLLGAVSPVYVVVTPKPEYRWFLRFHLRRAHTRAWIETLASGSVRQSLSYSDFASIPCVLPPTPAVKAFNRRWSTLREGMRLRQAQSAALTELRDTLLPKLISGELRVKDPDTFIRRVTA